jgi:hypothetical protein
MTNLLESGLHWLAAKQKKFVSSQVIYCRDDIRHSVDAVLGRTRFETADENGCTSTSHTIVFLIQAVDFALIPHSGDQIIVGEKIHEVIDLGDGGCWQWCDPHGITRRIHTQLFKEK